MNIYYLGTIGVHSLYSVGHVPSKSADYEFCSPASESVFLFSIALVCSILYKLCLGMSFRSRGSHKITLDRGRFWDIFNSNLVNMIIKKKWPGMAVAIVRLLFQLV